MSSLRFTKTQGAGNDFLIIEGSQDILPTPAKQRFCDRHYGVGADGVIFLSRLQDLQGVDAALRIFNSDGGEAEISGNGTRCAAAFLLHTANRESDLTIKTVAGIKHLRFISRKGTEYFFEMNMGPPIFDAASIPFSSPTKVQEPIREFVLPLAAGSKRGTITSMGNPHCSIAVENFDWDWRACGREIEQQSYFPKRTNVEFYRPLSEHVIEVRYWERGVGETSSSGTGSSAAAVAAILNGHAKSPVDVMTPAGKLLVRWEADGVYLTGPAQIVYHGEYIT